MVGDDGEHEDALTHDNNHHPVLLRLRVRCVLGGLGSLEARVNQLSDYERYERIQAKMRTLLHPTGALDSKSVRDEFMALWAKSEQIKNRHGGMPPQPEEKEQA